MPNLIETESLFIHYSAPTLCKIKPANLFTFSENQVHNMDLDKWKSKLQSQNLSLIYFKNSSNRWMIFVYNPFWVSQIISDVLVQAYLFEKGYENPLDTPLTLEDLFNRIKNSKNFPHEIGLFLGYPFEDVIAFEKNKGKNCKYCGYWKSYSNPCEAKTCCNQYKCCSQICKQLFDEGLSVPQIIKKYKEAVINAA